LGIPELLLDCLQDCFEEGAVERCLSGPTDLACPLPTERYVPPGQDRGYLWRAATFTRFVEADGGVYMEMETIGLSRPFPPLLGWVIEPIARRIGRGSVENSIQEFRRAVLARRS